MFFPAPAWASGGISEFTGPIESVVGTITGPVGRGIAIIGMALCGVVFILNKDDISGGFKLLLGVVFGICFIAFASSIVNSLFSFSGAVVWNFPFGQETWPAAAITAAKGPVWGSGAVI